MRGQLLQRLSEDELSRRVQEKMDAFSGLLTEEGALRILAHECGLKADKPVFHAEPLASAKAGENASVRVRVLQVFAPKAFQTSERSGTLCKARVADASGQGELVLWNQDASFFNHVSRHAVLCVKDAFVKGQDPLELHARLSTEMWVDEDGTGLPQAVTSQACVRDATGSEQDVVARVAEVLPLKEFDRNGKKGFLTKMRVADDSGSAWVACWDGNAHAAQNLSVGDAVMLEGASFRNNELHVNWAGRLLVNPKNHGLPEAPLPYPRKKLAELDGGEAVVEGTVGFVFDAKRVPKDGQGPLAFASFEFKDDSGSMRAVLFGSPAEAFLGATPDTDLSVLFPLKRDYLAGKPVRVVGYAKYNDFSKEKELVVRRVLP
ncbi:hypothetical protein HY572_00095 [Candidatus Micrarchaeota archaeon]|nr:hypothetical protein [Candidatus Micrarchaeota archaeon]